MCPRARRVSFRNFKLRPTDTAGTLQRQGPDRLEEVRRRRQAPRRSSASPRKARCTSRTAPATCRRRGSGPTSSCRLECRTNGKNLNSGVFFRCLPGEYQNGYEAQIHNGFADTPKEYAVEEYDPKTHELKGKKKVKSAAIDYGTGAIYRRVPARTHAAKDREWFTMTVVAHGRHIATWVNGVQQVDWTDNRPPTTTRATAAGWRRGRSACKGTTRPRTSTSATSGPWRCRRRPRNERG